ncbi:hypothetical protein ACFLVS_02500 [Chloroflexota bacterium]
MKKSFGLFILFILLFLFIASCACPSSTPQPVPTPTPSPQPSPAPNTEQAKQLARMFCPILYLKGEEEAIENFDPEQIEIMVDTAVLREVGDPTFSLKATLSSLLEWSNGDYYLDLAGLGTNTHSLAEYKLTYDEVRDRYKPTLYARVREGEGEDHTVVQYWIFYYFNDWRNFHEGDWELVQLNFPGSTAKELLETGGQPLFAAYSQHQAGQRMSWTEMMDKGLVEATHPVVYVAQGSHANYFTPGNFWSGLDFDDTGLSSWKILGPEQLEVTMLPEVEAREEGSEWLEFKGHWGEYLGFSVSVLGLKFWQQGPFGPAWSEEEHKNERWEHPDEWAAGLPEYPKPFWTSFLKLPGDLFKLAVFSVFSPADLHIYDSIGRHVGINEKGELEKQIPGAMYITPEGTDYKIILVSDADVADEYVMVARGTGSGMMDMKAQVPDAVSKLRRFLEYIDVPISVTTTAQAKIEPTRPDLFRVPSPPEVLGGTTRDVTTTLEIDADGDGAFEIESKPGNFEQQRVIRPVLNARIDIEPDTLNLSLAGAEKPITAYIELTAEISLKDIDISTIFLFGNITTLDRSIDIMDHDQNGIYELVVKFDRQVVVNYLISIKQVEREVTFVVTGIANGQSFKGVDTVIVTRSAPSNRDSSVNREATK